MKGNIEKYYKKGVSNWKTIIYRNMLPLQLQEYIDCNRQKNVYGNSNILFFHVPKVAGRSFNYMLYKKENSLHITAKNYLKFFRRHLNDNFSFAMMRCPAERIISSFYFLKSGGTKDCRVDYKSIYQSEVFNSIYLEENGFSFCPEITTKIGLKNIKIKEVPIEYFGRTYKEGKKIKFIDGIKALITIIKYRFFK